MEASWVRGFEILEQVAESGGCMRYLGRRTSDGALAWIRVDSHDPGDVKATVQIARIYAATAGFDQPDLPAVLGYGATTVAGRPFIAFQLETESSRTSRMTAGEVSELLAELSLMAYEAGLGGIHIPAHELDRVRQGTQLQGRRLSIREYLADPRRPDGASAFLGSLPEGEWRPFTAPEAADPRKARTSSVRSALAYRVGSWLHYLENGAGHAQGSDLTHREIDMRIGGEEAQAGDSASSRTGLAGRARTVRSSLSANPARRPPLESFVVHSASLPDQ